MFNLTFRHHVGNLGRPSTRRYDLWALASPANKFFSLQAVQHSSALPPPWVRPSPWRVWLTWSRDPGPTSASVWPTGSIVTLMGLITLTCPSSRALQLMAGHPRNRARSRTTQRVMMNPRTAVPRACSAMSLLAVKYILLLQRLKRFPARTVPWCPQLMSPAQCKTMVTQDLVTPTPHWSRPHRCPTEATVCLPPGPVTRLASRSEEAEGSTEMTQTMSPGDLNTRLRRDLVSPGPEPPATTSACHLPAIRAFTEASRRPSPSTPACGMLQGPSMPGRSLCSRKRRRRRTRLSFR